MEGQSAIIAPGRGVVSRRRDQALVKSAASLHAGHKPHRILHGAQPAKLAGRRTVERATSPPATNRSIRWGPHHRPPCEECFRKASPSETPSRAGRWPLHRIPFLSEHRTIHEVAMTTTSSSGQERMARTGPSAANRSELVGSSTPPGRSTPRTTAADLLGSGMATISASDLGQRSPSRVGARGGGGPCISSMIVDEDAAPGGERRPGTRTMFCPAVGKVDQRGIETRLEGLHLHRRSPLGVSA